MIVTTVSPLYQEARERAAAAIKALALPYNRLVRILWIIAATAAT